MLMDSDPSLSFLRHVERLLVGGEPFPEHLLKRLHANDLFRGRLYNLYGPTETTVWSTCKDLTRADTVTIGRPIANTRAYIVSDDRLLTPNGVPGELWLSGAGLGEGYVGDQDETEERFVEAPFDPDQRDYRTGDIARWLEDGELELLGRRDRQVKIRGYRVELSEIEEVLLTSGLVDAAVVVDREDQRGDIALCAYVVGGATVDTAELRAWVEARLPAYMMPSWFVRLDVLPLTVGGKIDRRRLPPPARANLELDRGFVAPASDLERSIAEVFELLLGVGEVGIDDSFFELGINSLKLVQAARELGRRLDRDVPLVHLFSAPTVRSLAARLESEQVADDRGAAGRDDPSTVARGRERLARRRKILGES
jgi:non-ribosomal peptide synthetase component F